MSFSLANETEGKRGRIAGRVLFLLFIIQLSLSACGRKEQVNLPVPSVPVETTSTGVKTSYAAVVERSVSAVVTIRTESRARTPQQFPFMDDPFFRRFFGDRLPLPPESQRGLGSGVLVTTDGYILTNHHVIDAADKILVELSGPRSVGARLVGSDPPSDLAVLKIEQTGLPALALADSDKVQIGDIVLAIGNPLGIGQTVTMGIISAKGRRTGLSNGSFEDFLQTDAPINRGNSGGALVDSNGNLIGINSQILSPSGGSIGIGFAIPSNMAAEVLDQLVRYGKVRRGHLGIVVQRITDELAEGFGLSSPRGVLVSQVQRGSAAEKAGLKRGDIVLALNGEAISDPNGFRNEIAGTPPGRTITLKIFRDGNEGEVRPTLQELEPEERVTPPTDNRPGESPPRDSGKLGLSVQPLTPQLAEELGLSNATQGVVVSEVDPSGPAADAGIRRGDIIEQVNREPVRSIADLRRAIERSGNRPIILLVNHRGTTFFVTVQPR